ncbi:DegT/DnrJ/EryC1/StrS family aminotransferase [Thermodesulfitimonas sp.]
MRREETERIAAPGLPAIAGGEPVRETQLPWSLPHLDERDVEAVVAVLRSGRLAAGPRVREFEERFAQLLGVRYAVAVATGTAALHAAYYAAGISREDEVILSPFASPAVGSAVLYLGARPVFADIDAETLTIDPALVAMNITEKTRAVVATHFAGFPCALEALQELAYKHNLLLIEDATEALGAVYRGRQAGNFGVTAAFSFHQDGVITTGNGGMVVTNDEDTYRWLRLFTDRGEVRDVRDLVLAGEGPWHYEVQELGCDYRPTELQGALGLAQLAKLETFLKRRREIAARYNEAFADLPYVELPKVHPDAVPAWQLYVLKLNLERLHADRRQIFLALLSERIKVGVHYLPVYLHPLYGWIGDPTVCTLHQGPPCPKAEAIYKRLLTLPLYPAMTDADVEEVIKAVRRVLIYFAK